MKQKPLSVSQGIPAPLGRGVVNNSTLVNVLSLGLIFLVGNTILFGLTALLVNGFRLRWGVISALLGGVGTAVISGIVAKLLATVV